MLQHCIVDKHYIVDIRLSPKMFYKWPVVDITALLLHYCYYMRIAVHYCSTAGTPYIHNIHYVRTKSKYTTNTWNYNQFCSTFTCIVVSMSTLISTNAS